MRADKEAKAAQLDGAPAGEKDRARAHKLRNEKGKVVSYWFLAMWDGEGGFPGELELAGAMAGEEGKNGSALGLRWVF